MQGLIPRFRLKKCFAFVFCFSQIFKKRPPQSNDYTKSSFLFKSSTHITRFTEDVKQ